MQKKALDEWDQEYMFSNGWYIVRVEEETIWLIINDVLDSF